MAKKKRMTNAEKNFRAKVKKELQQEGKIPSDKPKLNRKKYIEETRELWNIQEEKFLVLDIHMIEALNIMMGKVDRRLNFTLEAVGAAKAMRLAIKLKEFYDIKREKGETEYLIKEKYEYLKEILDA